MSKEPKDNLKETLKELMSCLVFLFGILGLLFSVVLGLFYLFGEVPNEIRKFDEEICRLMRPFILVYVIYAYVRHYKK